ncbi:hypothetical protein [Ottowia sp.]|uniref:hypothetical protein n=1 Tax=Ottowia sp. TaxID=1898956 RepID=UPI002CE4CC6C|nr:hypothetical protein [Ottowia sp.]HMN15538.1 hypothetical protein [Bellilinea sp.]
MAIAEKKCFKLVQGNVWYESIDGRVAVAECDYLLLQEILDMLRLKIMRQIGCFVSAGPCLLSRLRKGVIIYHCRDIASPILLKMALNISLD